MQYRLTQGELAEIIAATLHHNGLHPTDIAFDTTPDSIELYGVSVIATCEGERLKVVDSPRPDLEIDSVSKDVLKQFRTNHAKSG